MIIRWILAGFGFLLASCQLSPPQPEQPVQPLKRPNILLVVFEDMSERIGAFGDDVATTPILDAFARESIRFPNTFTTAGVCAPSRASLITGVHQQTLGAQHMRTHAFRTQYKPSGFEIGYAAVPPPEVKAFPELLRKAGYYTFAGYGGWVISNKKDYQFGTPFTVWDEDVETASWQGRAPGQPFFGMVTLATTHESFLFPDEPVLDAEFARRTAKRNKRLLADAKKITDPNAVIVPPWLPDTPQVRAEIATQYDNIAFTEKKLAVLLSDLQAAGLAEETIVIVTTDHGDGFPRAKRSVYDSGLKVPLMIRLPENEHAGEVRDELISFVDLAPTILAMAGVERPDWLQGRNFLGEDRDTPNDYVFAASDRMDAWTDRMKAVRDARYKLIRNFDEDVPFFQPVEFRRALRSMQALEAGESAGKLPVLQGRYFATPRPIIELYDTKSDPDETINLAEEATYSGIRSRLSTSLQDWLDRTPDWSAMPESEMVEAMWPGGKQPLTQAPAIAFRKAAHGGFLAALRTRTEGASLGFRVRGSTNSEWQIYSSEVLMTVGGCIEAKAVRYGYGESKTAFACAPEAPD